MTSIDALRPDRTGHAVRRPAAVPTADAVHDGYRADIDGLRAVAVLAVLFYHFGLPGAAGGFVGVDVFFVISGFLIGRSVIADIRARRFSLVRFYERRIRRLFPAFLAMVAVCVPLFLLLLLPNDLRGFGRSMVAALGYGANIAFYKQHGYFDAAAITKPLLHTWSLAVEEQFYLVFPPLVWLAGRGGRVLAPVLGVIALLSLAAAQLTLRTDATAAFFLFQYRAWELLVGVMLTFIGEKDWPDWLDRLRDPLAFAALFLILWPVMSYGAQTPFPGLAALPPCLGAAGLILTGSDGRGAVANRLLAMSGPRAVGLISYSLYLWHWPILVALSFYIGTPLPTFWVAVGLVGALVTAALSWRFVELPVRRSRRIGRGLLFSAAFASSCIFAAIGFFFYHWQGLPGRFTGANAALVTAADDFDQTGGECVGADNSSIPGLAYCRLGDPTAWPSFLVWADSHGRAWRDGIDLLARERGTAGLLVWQGGCPPAFDTGKQENVSSATENRACLRQNQRMAALLATDRQLNRVLLLGRWAYYLTGTGTGADVTNHVTLLDSDDRPVGLAKQITATIATLRAQGRTVFVAEQVPEIPYANARSIAQQVINGRVSLTQALNRYAIVPRRVVELRQAGADDLMNRAGATLLSTHQLLCTPTICSSWQDGGPVLFDNNHLTVTASRRFRSVLTPAIAPVVDQRSAGAKSTAPN